MSRIDANEMVSALLEPIRETSQIFNDRGVLIGTFTPAETAEDKLYRKAAALFDPEEIRRIKAAGGPWRTTSEMLDHLRSLEKS